MAPKKPDLDTVAAQVEALTARVETLETRQAGITTTCLHLADAAVGGHSRMPDVLVKALQDWMKGKH